MASFTFFHPEFCSHPPKFCPIKSVLVHRQQLCLLIDRLKPASSSILQPKLSNTHLSFSLILWISSFPLRFLTIVSFFTPPFPHLNSFSVLFTHDTLPPFFFFIRPTTISFLTPSPCHIILCLATIPPLPYIPPSLTGYWFSHSFLSSCAGWLALINIDNCLLSLHARHAAFFSMNSGLSLMQPAGPSLFFPLYAGIPPLMTGDNLLFLLIFLPLPPFPCSSITVRYHPVCPFQQK